LLAAALVSVALVALPGMTTAVSGPSANATSFEGRSVTIRADHTTAPARRTNLLRSASVLAGTPTADIQVTYNGFSVNAHDAFEAAVNVWEHLLVSSKPIHVNAHWEPLGNGILGSAGPTAFYLGDDDYVYPAALAEARCACNLKSGNEITASFNSNFPDWYLGADGNVPGTKWDFFSVVLHELGHGLGFMSSFDVINSKGYWGFSNDGITWYPMRFDSYEMSALTGGTSLIDGFGNGTNLLKNELTDDSVFFTGPKTVTAAGGAVKLYAPSPWEPGSSNSHVDQAEYESTAESLMTPALTNGHADGPPGPVTLAMMQDIGWEIAADGGGGGAPANDNFVDAVAPGLNSVSTATTTDATLELDEPQPACATGTDKTVWYSYTPGRTRTVVAKTVGSDFDTVLAIYTGTDLATFTPVACNDNRAVDNLSKLKLSLAGGTTYFFQVGGASGESGALTFQLKKP
jgi:hypothetical protein